MAKTWEEIVDQAWEALQIAKAKAFKNFQEFPDHDVYLKAIVYAQQDFEKATTPKFNKLAK